MRPELVQGILFAVLLLGIGAGIYLRFAQPLANYPNDDEITNFISATKLNIDHPDYDARVYNFEHPFLGKKIMGLFIDPAKNYSHVRAEFVNLFYYNYLSAFDLKGQEGTFRFMCALFGALALIPLFLIGKFIHGKEAGLITALLGSISIAFINQSRLAYQDAFLPFFFFFSIYFALRYYFERPERTTYGIRTEWIWLGACVIAVAASLLVRIGQPILLLIALAWMFYSNHEKRTHFWGALITAIAIGAWGYGAAAIKLLLRTRGDQVVPFSLHVDFIIGIISQNAITFLGLLVLIALSGVVLHFPAARKKIQLFFSTNTTTHYERETVFLRLLPIVVLGLICTATGALPRFYAVFFVIPFVWVAGRIAHRVLPHWKIILFVGLILLDVVPLVQAEGVLYRHSTLGLNPKFNYDITDEIKEVSAFIEKNQVKTYFTNDARLIMRDERAIPAPPFSGRYADLGKCNQSFFDQLEKGYVLVYQNHFPLSHDEYICPIITQQKHQVVAAFPSLDQPNEIVYWITPRDQNA